MLFLWILLGIVLFFALLCAIPLRLRIRLEEAVMLEAGIGALVLLRIPKVKKPVRLSDFTYEKHQKRLAKEAATAERKKQKAKAKADKKAAKSQRKKAKDTSAAKVGEITEAARDAGKKENKLAGILSLVQCVLSALPGFFGGFRCKIYCLDVTVGGKDAADAAKNFAVYSQSLAYLLEFLTLKTRFVKPRENTIAIRADFLSEKTKVKADLYLQLRVGQILATVLGIGARYIKKLVKKSI